MTCNSVVRPGEMLLQSRLFVSNRGQMECSGKIKYEQENHRRKENHKNLEVSFA